MAESVAHSKSIKTPASLASQICGFLEESKAVDVVQIDLAGKSTMADDLVIATGRSRRHLKMISEKLKHHLHDLGVISVPIEGLTQCDWVLVDAGDVIVHLFRPEVRQFYNLEKMWSVRFSASPFVLGHPS